MKWRDRLAVLLFECGFLFPLFALAHSFARGQVFFIGSVFGKREQKEWHVYRKIKTETASGGTASVPQAELPTVVGAEFIAVLVSCQYQQADITQAFNVFRGNCAQRRRKYGISSYDRALAGLLCAPALFIANSGLKKSLERVRIGNASWPAALEQGDLRPPYELSRKAPGVLKVDDDLSVLGGVAWNDDIRQHAVLSANRNASLLTQQERFICGLSKCSGRGCLSEGAICERLHTSRLSFSRRSEIAGGGDKFVRLYRGLRAACLHVGESVECGGGRGGRSVSAFSGRSRRDIRNVISYYAKKHQKEGVYGKPIVRGELPLGNYKLPILKRRIFGVALLLFSLAFLLLTFRFGERAVELEGPGYWRNVGIALLFVFFSQVFMYLSLSSFFPLLADSQPVAMPSLPPVPSGPVRPSARTGGA